MGIDIYARWKGQTEAEKDAQLTGFSVVHGHVGYLREAYHGEPYATKYLLAEAFASKKGQANIPAHLLRDRLPKTLELAEERSHRIYQSSPEEIEKGKQSFRDFVALCEEKERATGQPCLIVASY